MSTSIHSFIGLVDYQLTSDSIKDLFFSRSSGHALDIHTFKAY